MAMNRFFPLFVLSILIASCGQTFEDAPQQADQALDELKKYYEEAKQKAPEDPIEWAKEDFQRFGDWEYRVVSIELGSNKEIENQLNEFGTNRWEVFWVQEREDSLQILLKRPARSYLRSVPFSELGKAISGDGKAE